MGYFSKFLGVAAAVTLLSATLVGAEERDPLKPRVPADQLADAKALKNPVANTPESIAKGKALFEGKGTCFNCHGKEGKGDGPAASTMTRRPTNVTLMQKRHGAFFAAQAESAIRGTDPVVAHGAPGMMVWGAIFRANAHGGEAAVDARVRDLLAFMESIQEK